MGVAGLVPGLEGIDGSSGVKGLVARIFGSESSLQIGWRRENLERFDDRLDEEFRLVGFGLGSVAGGGGGSESFDPS